MGALILTSYDERVSEQAHPTQESLATSRPWLSVAGCLGASAIAAAFIALLAVLALVVYFLFPDLVFGGKGGSASYLSALGELRKAPALRVATREINVRVDASTPTETTLRAWIVPIGPGWSVEVGRTKVEIVATGNIAQYIVPLASESVAVASSVVVDGEVVTITLPPPRVDETLVEVQSDPKKLRIEVDRDWIDHVVGDDTARDEALSLIRAAVVREASSDLAMFEVRAKAKATVAEMIRALIPASERGRTIRVRWSDEADNDAIVE